MTRAAKQGDMPSSSRIPGTAAPRRETLGRGMFIMPLAQWRDDAARLRSKTWLERLGLCSAQTEEETRRAPRSSQDHRLCGLCGRKYRSQFTTLEDLPLAEGLPGLDRSRSLSAKEYAAHWCADLVIARLTLGGYGAHFRHSRAHAGSCLQTRP